MIYHFVISTSFNNKNRPIFRLENYRCVNETRLDGRGNGRTRSSREQTFAAQTWIRRRRQQVRQTLVQRALQLKR